jgi:hypothetical protein
VTYARPTGIPCPKHELPTVVTQSGLQHVCVIPDCDFSVRLQGPRREDEKVMSPKAPLATVSNPNDKAARKAAIDEAIAKKKAKQAEEPAPADDPPAKKKVKDGANPPAKAKKPKAAPEAGADAELDQAVSKKKAEKKADDPDMVSVSDIARELGLDPKRARAKLRAAGQAATEGRWPKVKRGSKKYQELVAMLSPEPADEEENEEEEDEEENEDEE